MMEVFKTIFEIVMCLIGSFIFFIPAIIVWSEDKNKDA